MPAPTLLEIAVFNQQSGYIAARCGAHRLELCRDKARDGLTPCISTFQALAREGCEINVMIREEDNGSRGFTVRADEFDVMREQIERFRGAGARGFVFGILEGVVVSGLRIDRERCRDLVELCRRGLGADDADKIRCTFHRAFDRIPVEWMEEELEALIDLGFTSVLMSGGAPTALEGLDVIRKMVEKAAGRIEVIVGGGVRTDNVVELKQGTGANCFHSSAVVGEGDMADEYEARGLCMRLDPDSGV